MPWRADVRRSVIRSCKHEAQKVVEILHCCCLGVRPTVDRIWHNETSAIWPHSLHNFFCMEIPFRFIEQAEGSYELIETLLV